MKEKVDIAINIYGKPYQTLVSIETLLKHCKDQIDTFYFILEKNQPNNFKVEDLVAEIKKLPIKAIFHTPQFFLGAADRSEGFKNRLKFYYKPYRNSIKYQYALENSDKKYVLVMHNDMYYTGDIISHYVSNIEEHLAIGTVGQCWNCPAHQTKCFDHQYIGYKPNPSELLELYKDRSDDRVFRQNVIGPTKKSWPLPECRLNEYVCLINNEKNKEITFPKGRIVPFGTHNNLDFGIPWFHEASRKGHTFKHISYDDFAVHGWCSMGQGGTESLKNKTLYIAEEEFAQKIFIEKDYSQKWSF